MEGDPLFVSATITVLGPYKDALFILLLPEQLFASLRVKSAAVAIHPRLGGGLEPLQRKALLRHTLAHLRVRLEVHVEQVQHELLHQGGQPSCQRIASAITRAYVSGGTTAGARHKKLRQPARQADRQASRQKRFTILYIQTPDRPPTRLLC